MRIIERVTEAETIATFLRAITSSRFGKDILRILKRDRIDRKVIDNLNVTDAAENEYREISLKDFTIENITERVKKKGDIFKAVLTDKQSLEEVFEKMKGKAKKAK